MLLPLDALLLVTSLRSTSSPNTRRQRASQRKYIKRLL